MSQSPWQWSQTLGQYYYIRVENGREVCVCEDGTRRRVPDQRDPRTPPAEGNNLGPAGSYQYGNQYTTDDELSNRTRSMSLANDASGSNASQYLNPPEERDANGIASRITVGPQGQKVLLGSSGEQEVLDPDYRKRSSPRSFFKVGKVFLTLWSEPSGRQDNDTMVTRVRFREHVYTQIRRFVVIQEGHRHCIAVPILTYGGRALTKGDVEASEHALIYTGAQPALNSGDEGIIQIPLRVDPSETGQRLDPLSRVNLAKWYTIEHNLKVKPFGMIRSVPALMEAVYRATGTRMAQMRDAAPAPHVSIPQAGSSGAAGNQRRAPDGAYQQQGSTYANQQAVAGSSGQTLQSSATAYLYAQLQAGQITPAQHQAGLEQLEARARAIQAMRDQQAANEDESSEEEEEDNR